jgi:hypothetical protein
VRPEIFGCQKREVESVRCLGINDQLYWNTVDQCAAVSMSFGRRLQVPVGVDDICVTRVVASETKWRRKATLTRAVCGRSRVRYLPNNNNTNGLAWGAIVQRAEGFLVIGITRRFVQIDCRNSLRIAHPAVMFRQSLIEFPLNIRDPTRVASRPRRMAERHAPERGIPRRLAVPVPHYRAFCARLYSRLRL